MHRALAVCLVLVGGCSTPKLDLGAQQAALKSGKSCLISGVSYDKGQGNPTNPCQLCKPEHDSTGWTNADDGARCDDGNECTRADSCQAGACVGGDPFVCKPKNAYRSPVKAECCLHGSAVIGGAGGTVKTGNGTIVTIPLGAVDRPTTITVSESATPPPASLRPASAVIDLGPNGIVFTHPITVTVPLTRTSGNLTTWLTSHDGSGTFEPVGGRVVGDTMVVEINHFSSLVVADDPGTRTITGTEVTKWVGTQSVDDPADLTAIAVEALVADGSGGYTSYVGTGDTMGLFSIAGVPVSTAIVHTGNLYSVLDVSTDTVIDLGTVVEGRKNAPVADPNDTLDFNITGMSAWQDGDDMELFCATNNNWIFGMDRFSFQGYPQPGDTSITDMQIRERAFFGGGGSPGKIITSADLCTLSHLQTLPSNDAPPVLYTAMTETFNSSFDQTDAAGGAVFAVPSGPFARNATPSTISVDARFPDFVKLLGNPPQGSTVRNPQYLFGIAGTMVADDNNAAIGNSADFLLLDVTANPQATVVHDMKWGMPLSGRWNVGGGVVTQTNYAFHAPGGGPTATAAVNQAVFAPADLTRTDLQVVEPVVGPPGSPQVNGRDALQAQTNVGLTPTLTWTASSIGHADMYYVWVWQLDATAPPSNKNLVALVATTKTSLTLPSNILANGGQYVLSFDAYSVPPMTAQPTTVPFLTLPPAGAVVISSIIQP